MPDVFPCRVDWITLLVPPDMLAPTSVRARAVEVMDAEVCGDVEVVGWLYQFYNADLKEEINKSKVPIDAAELPAVTQLFTPDWIVRYLVENPSAVSGCVATRQRAPRLHEVLCRTDRRPGRHQASPCRHPRNPASSTRRAGPNMLTYAFDLMYRIYEEGYTPAPSRDSSSPTTFAE